MRKVSVRHSSWTDSGRVCRVAALDDAAGEWEPQLRLLVLVHNSDELASVSRLHDAGLQNIGWITGTDLMPGDIVVLRGQHAFVLYRESDIHHSLLLTNRCNSYCLMCSQPPTKHADEWLVDEALDVIHHMRNSPAVLGLSGGEPLLLGARLRQVIEAIKTRHPETRIDVLTNARLLGNQAVAASILDGLDAKVTWLVPLYGHAEFFHDFVVQAPGAFEETLSGLLALQAYRQTVQLRTVLIEPVLTVLPELCAFIGRNLPFIREFALMGCEPIGFALANREHCEVDLADWSDTLLQAGKTLRRYAVPFVLMNTPLCAIPRLLWPDAAISISDWKNVYADECSQCAVKPDCPGLFAWHERGWTPSRLLPIVELAS